jgi:sugar phosphate isomerase/epimerase
MYISVMLSNLGLPLEEALDAVVKMDIPAVQLRVTPKDDDASLQAMKQAVRDRGLKVSAICVDMGDLGETDSNSPVLEKMRPLIDAATVLCDGELAICQTHVGVMPHTMQGARWDAFVEGCRALAEYAQSVNATVAMETGPEPPRVMEALLKAVNNPGLSVNYDPANFILWPAILVHHPEYQIKTGIPPRPYNREEALREFEPVDGVKRLAPYIVHTHAKDGRVDERALNAPDTDPKAQWNDVLLGEGWVDWPRYLRLLKDNGFDGALAIEREAGSDPVGEITHAVNFLKAQLKELEG